MTALINNLYVQAFPIIEVSQSAGKKTIYAGFPNYRTKVQVYRSPDSFWVENSRDAGLILLLCSQSHKVSNTTIWLW